MPDNQKGGRKQISLSLWRFMFLSCLKDLEIDDVNFMFFFLLLWVHRFSWFYILYNEVWELGNCGSTCVWRVSRSCTSQDLYTHWELIRHQYIIFCNTSCWKEKSNFMFSLVSYKVKLFINEFNVMVYTVENKLTKVSKNILYFYR